MKHTSPDTQRITWHTAFFDAIRLELFPYRHILHFQAEHPLTTEPLRLDVLIIKKPPESIIHQPIGRIFKEHNLVEFKSPKDSLSIADFHKVLAYMHLYCALSGNVPVSHVSISYVVTKHPRELFAYLRSEYHWEIEERWPGIYYVDGVLPAIQIIESKRLEGVEHLWLRNLREDLGREAVEEVLEAQKEMPEGAPLLAYMYIFLKANYEGAMEVMKMSEATSFEAYLAETGLLTRWEARGEAIGEARGRGEKAIQIAKNLMKKGWSVEEIVETTELPVETVRDLYASAER